MLDERSKTLRRWAFIAISSFGIWYEFTQSGELRWLLIAGYVFIVLAAIYSLQAKKLESSEENE